MDDFKVPTPEQIAAVLDGERLHSDRYRRERIVTVTMAVVATLVVGAILSHLIGQRIRDTARYNAMQTCAVQEEGRVAGNQRAFAQREVLEVADRAFDRFPARFKDAVIADINDELQVRRPLLGNGDAPRVVRRFSDLQKFVELLPLVNCDKRLR